MTVNPCRLVVLHTVPDIDLSGERPYRITTLAGSRQELDPIFGLYGLEML